MSFVEKSIAHGSYAFDIEHPPELRPHDENFRLAGMSFATNDVAFYERDIPKCFEYLNVLFDHPDIESIAWNGKYDLKCLVQAGFKKYPKNFVDPMVALNLLDDNRTPHELGLKSATFDLFGHKMASFLESWNYGEESEEFAKYSTEDAYWELKCWEKMKPKLKKEGLDKIFEKILMPAALVFSDMELYGIGWDLEGAKKLLRGFQILRSSTEENIYSEIGELNIDSGDQIANRIFNELGYSTRGIEMTSSGKRYSVDSKAMDVLAKKYPVCEKIRTYRTASKMISTYIEPLTRMYLADPRGRVHPTYWLVSATGRTRCEKPNFQNIPKWLTKRPDFKKLSIRGNIVPEKGKKLVIADFSQIELRLVAHITKDEKFLKAYTAWQCKKCNQSGSSSNILHNCPKCGSFEDEDNGFWHGLDIHQQTTDLVPALEGDRQQGKTANFALVYGATAFKLAYEYPMFSKTQWQKVIDQYFDPHTGYVGVHKWHLKMQDILWSTGKCTDIFGRKRRIPKYKIQKSSKHALNQLVNFGPQASACGMMLLSMVKIREECIKKDLWMNGIWPQNMVHDEFVLEVSNDLVPDAVSITRKFMENCINLRVPVRADIDVSTRWVEDEK